MKGLAFAILTDRGFAIGLKTHKVSTVGELAWLSEPFFETVPSREEVEALADWRWCVFFPVTTGLRRKMLIRIGSVEIPEGLQEIPPLRAQSVSGDWLRYEHGDIVHPSGECKDPTVQVLQVVNYEMLREMLVTNWRPQDRWEPML